MKKTLLLGSLVFGLALGGSAATSSQYVNNGTIIAPPLPIPQIDATNFLNNGYFSIGNIFGDTFDFSNVRFYTNRGVLYSSTGFIFDTAPSEGPNTGILPRRRASSFVNSTFAALNPNPLLAYTNSRVATGPVLLSVNASNVINRGVLETDNQGVLRVQGNNVDMRRGMIRNLSAGGSAGGISMAFWGYTNPAPASLINITNNFVFKANPAYTNYFAQPKMPTVKGTNFGAGGLYGNGNLNVPAAPGFVSVVATQYIHEFKISPTNANRTVQVVFVGRSDTNINFRILAVGQTNGIDFDTIGVEFSAPATNAFGEVFTNYFSITDDFGHVHTNKMITNKTSFGGLQYAPVYIPTNFYSEDCILNLGARGFGRFPLALGSGGFEDPGTVYTKPVRANILGTNMLVTNYLCAGITVNLSPYTSDQGTTQPQSNYTGRIEVQADNYLDMSFARVDAANYLKINATNHFAGNNGAILAAPLYDIYLGSTNGSLTVTNFIASSSPRLAGTVSISSLFFTNQLEDVPTGSFAQGNTNAAPVPTHIVMVDCQLTTVSPSTLNNMSLQCTNTAGTNLPSTITVDDYLQFAESFTAKANNLALTANGVLYFTQPDFTWVDQLPYLNTLTNDGVIYNGNGIGCYFISRDSNGNEKPYDAVVNQTDGWINSYGGFTALANYFENEASITTEGGLISIEGPNVVLSNGGSTSQSSPYFSELISIGGDINIAAGSLLLNNHYISSDRAINLFITNSLTDTSGQGEQELDDTFYCQDGFNLWVKPATGDLTYATVTCYANDYAELISHWAGEDRGSDVSGYTDNVALGNLILDGGINSRFTFAPVGANNAMYIDRLDLNNSAAELDGDGNIVNVELQPGMKIYFSHIYLDGTDATASLSGKFGATGAAGGQFINVPHTGYYTRPGVGGSTIKAMTGGAGLDVKVGFITSPSLAAKISWNTVKGATSKIYYKNTMGDATWKLLQTSVASRSGRESITDSVGAAGRFYKVELNLAR